MVLYFGKGRVGYLKKSSGIGMGQVRENFDSQKSHISSLIFFTFTFFIIKNYDMKAVRVCGGEVMGDIALPRKLPSLPPVARRSPSAIGVYKYLQTSSKIGKLEIVPSETWSSS